MRSNSQLVGAGYTVLAAASCGEACHILECQPRLQVVLTELKMADGAWDVILGTITEKKLPVEIIVIFSGTIDRRYIDYNAIAR